MEESFVHVGEANLELTLSTTSPPSHPWASNVAGNQSGPSSSGSYYQEQQFPLYCLQVIIASFGLLTNVINILTFLKIGLSDCVTISFFNLAVSDLLHLICFVIIRLLTILQYEHGIRSSILQLQDLGGWFGWLSVYFMDVSMYITVFATVQKCCCVVFPLKFKNVFTKKRSWLVVSGIFVFTLGVFAPVFVNILDKWIFEPDTRDKPLDWIKLNSGLEATVWRWLHRITLTIISQVVVVLSFAVITTKLNKSLKFRLSTKAGGGEITHNAKDTEDELKASSTKERRAIKSVQFVALIFVLTTAPSSVNSMASVVFPEINRMARYRTTVFTLQALIYFGATINASANMFVYLTYNTKYRETVLRYIVGGGGSKSKLRRGED